MLRSRLLWKAFAGYGAVVLLTLAILGELIASGTDEELRAKTRSLLQTATGVAATEIAAALESPGDANPGATLQRRVVDIATAAGVRMTVIAESGAVQADSSAEGVRGANLGVMGEVLEARHEGIGWALRLDSAGEEVMHCARRIDADGGVLGFVRASVSVAGLAGRRAEITRIVLITALVALGAVFFLTWLQARITEQPLQEFTRSVDAMTRGDFSRRLLVHENDTVGSLATALNRLAASSRERIDTMATDRNKVVAILASVVEGVVAVDSGERVLHMNQAAARILGTDAARAQGRRLWEMTRVREVSAMLAATLRSGEEQIGEVRVVVPPRDRWIELRATPLHDAESAIAGAVVMLHDVTELRRLEAIRRDFVANVSHELKTPITAIRGMVETVLDDPEMEPEMRVRFLARIKEQSFRLSQLVGDLLTLSRLESESALGELAILDLRGPVRDSAQALSQSAEDRGIVVDVAVPERPVKILGEVESLRLVVNNLIDNALKYTPEGGHVWVRLRTHDGLAILEVEDDGIGIEPKHLDRIFQRFYRVDKARSRELGGTGLGLSIVKHVCLAHRGEVTVDSAAGRGTTFFVKLPLA